MSAPVNLDTDICFFKLAASVLSYSLLSKFFSLQVESRKYCRQVCHHICKEVQQNVS